MHTSIGTTGQRTCDYALALPRSDGGFAAGLIVLCTCTDASVAALGRTAPSVLVCRGGSTRQECRAVRGPWTQRRPFAVFVAHARVVCSQSQARHHDWLAAGRTRQNGQGPPAADANTSNAGRVDASNPSNVGRSHSERWTSPCPATAFSATVSPRLGFRDPPRGFLAFPCVFRRGPVLLSIHQSETDDAAAAGVKALWRGKCRGKCRVFGRQRAVQLLGPGR